MLLAQLPGMKGKGKAYPHRISQHRQAQGSRLCCIACLLDAKAKGVHVLLPTLLSYKTELCLAGYPPWFLLHVFRSFLQHPKVASCLSWHQLFAEFQTTVHTERACRTCLNPIIL